MIPGRLRKQQHVINKVFLTFVTAYLFAVQSMAQLPQTKKNATDILAHLDNPEHRTEPDDKGNTTPKMSAIITSFSICGGEIFMATLQALRWAGHLRKLSTLLHFRFALETVVDCYYAHETRYEAEPPGLIPIAKTQLFQRCKIAFRHFVVSLKVTGGNTTSKPTPIMEGDIKKCAEMAQAGGITPMYGVVISMIKFICGCRNPVFAALQWKHIKFIPTLIFNEATEEAEVTAFDPQPALYTCTYMPRNNTQLQVAFGFASGIPWDKAPNKFGQKTFAIDMTGGIVNITPDKRQTDIACVGNLLLMLAIAQGLITLQDLHNLPLAEEFTVAQLVANRGHRQGHKDVGEMCAISPHLTFSIGNSVPTHHMYLTPTHLQVCFLQMV